MVESALDSLAGDHMAAAITGVVGNETVGPVLYDRDTGSFPVAGNSIRLTSDRGLGYVPAWDVIDKLAFAREAVRL